MIKRFRNTLTFFFSFLCSLESKNSNGFDGNPIHPGFKKTAVKASNFRQCKMDNMIQQLLSNTFECNNGIHSVNCLFFSLVLYNWLWICASCLIVYGVDFIWISSLKSTCWLLQCVHLLDFPYKNTQKGTISGSKADIHMICSKSLQRKSLPSDASLNSKMQTQVSVWTRSRLPIAAECCRTEKCSGMQRLNVSQLWSNYGCQIWQSLWGWRLDDFWLRMGLS